MLEYPHINPVVLHLTDTLQIRWYGLLYLIGFLGGWIVVRWRTRNLPDWKSGERLSDLLFYTALGVIIGGRVGYMLFYSLGDWIDSPLLLFKVWQGGMSFHGGLLGVVVSTWLYSRHFRYPFLFIGDIIAPAIPMGIITGRLGNFINGELWGRTSEVPWAMVFPHAGILPRHPYPLYAILLEGILLFAILWIYSSKARKIGAVSGMFLLCYGVIRIVEEFFRQPDPQYGYLAFHWVTMGQLLCLPMILFGCFLIWRSDATVFSAAKASD